jgi:hypothetical protein
MHGTALASFEEPVGAFVRARDLAVPARCRQPHGERRFAPEMIGRAGGVGEVANAGVICRLASCATDGSEPALWTPTGSSSTAPAERSRAYAACYWGIE